MEGPGRGPMGQLGTLTQQPTSQGLLKDVTHNWLPLEENFMQEQRENQTLSCVLEQIVVLKRKEGETQWAK